MSVKITGFLILQDKDKLILARQFRLLNPNTTQCRVLQQERGLRSRLGVYFAPRGQDIGVK